MGPGLVRRRQHYSAGRTADDHRGAPQLWTPSQLDGSIEGIHVDVHHNAARHDAPSVERGPTRHSPIERVFD